jgi:hypothetical protein
MLKLLGAAPLHHVSHPGKGAALRQRQASRIDGLFKQLKKALIERRLPQN